MAKVARILKTLPYVKNDFSEQKGKNTMMSSVKNARIIMSATRCISEIEKMFKDIKNCTDYFLLQDYLDYNFLYVQLEEKQPLRYYFR